MPVEINTMSMCALRRFEIQLTCIDYTCVIFGGLTIIMCAFYLLLRNGYEGPQVVALGRNSVMTAREYRNSIQI